MLVGHAADQDEAPVAIAAIGKALIRINFQPHARMAKRGIGKAVTGSVTSDAGFGDAKGFGRSNVHMAGSNSNAARHLQMGHARCVADFAAMPLAGVLIGNQTLHYMCRYMSPVVG